ncbi:MAG: aldehyde dehydrogenase family protein, partial [Gimesia sp.]|nr:aldehyde dehydrogenase family protein [Gimesia sp.]
MQATEEAIRSVVQEVLAQLKQRGGYGSTSPAANQDGDWGVFSCVDQAVAAATEGQNQLLNASMEDRAKAVEIVRQICATQADELGRLELEETNIGRLDHKIEKLHLIKNIPGMEFLKTEAVSGDYGVSLTEYAPFGVIGAITPVTHSLPTLACNFVNMVSSGNTLVVNPHPGGAKIACEGVRRFNQAIYQATGLQNLVTILGTPTLETADEIFNHRGIPLLCVTGGPGVARAALAAKKRAIVAGPGNPPVVVDETADIDNAAKSIIIGAAYDNNLLCIGEKEVFAVDSIFDELMSAMGRHGGYQLNAQQTAQLTSL